MNDDEIFDLITNIWVPSEGYEYPFRKSWKFSHDWLRLYPTCVIQSILIVRSASRVSCLVGIQSKNHHCEIYTLLFLQRGRVPVLDSQITLVSQVKETLGVVAVRCTRIRYVCLQGLLER